MEREYIRITEPSSLPTYTPLLKELDDEFWKKWIFYYLLTFYRNYDSVELKEKIETEKKKPYPKVEREIAKFLRKKLNADKKFGYHFTVFGESTNDEDIEGNYDVTIHSTNWKSKNFHFECKILDSHQDLVNKYVCYNKGHLIYDGGVYRYFNGKYAQNSSFGGMIGFVIEGNVADIKNKIVEKLKNRFDITPEGDLLSVVNSSIEKNEFTFDSNHKRFDNEFLIHHLLFDFT